LEISSQIRLDPSSFWSPVREIIDLYQFGGQSAHIARLVSYRSGFYSDGAYFGRGERIILLSNGLIIPWKIFTRDKIYCIIKI